MTAEMWSNWALYIAPVVLRGRFKKDKYYKHFINLVKLLKLCLAFEIDETMLKEIDEGFKSWVQAYEKLVLFILYLLLYSQLHRLYYRNDPDRLSACPLTIHALLHILGGIHMIGPVWTSWAFPMERHCNLLLPAIKSRRYPYESINSFVTATAQLNQIQLLYNLDKELFLDPEQTERNTLTHELCMFN